MENRVFSDDIATEKELVIAKGGPIAYVVKTISADAGQAALQKGEKFAAEVAERFVSDFEKADDKMAHVSTFAVIDDTVYIYRRLPVQRRFYCTTEISACFTRPLTADI